ncbi:MAG: DUF1848 domain-containing protein [Candidatus Latescibacterota bacterium]|nr:MAG: DUF1848 domain-containing protein [Candidatus Latescibacterota bacterium]
MIISASRRTDIPAFYSRWFMNRIREGYCLVPNPFNPTQVANVSLRPRDVDTVVFWSKNPEPLVSHLDEIDALGFVYYFLFTLNDYPAVIEPNLPSLDHRVAVFKTLSKRLGAERVIWRYDPIVISSETPYEFHRRRFDRIAGELSGHTRRVIVSLVDYYRKTDRRLAMLESTGIVFDRNAGEHPGTLELFRHMSGVASSHGMAIHSCAEPSPEFAGTGVRPGSCIDGALIKRLGAKAPSQKDPGQRDACRCAVSKDIGVTDTCLGGCRYCYATRNHELARRRHSQHDPRAPVLWGPAETR